MNSSNVKHYPSVAVLCTTFNGINMLIQQLDSIIKQNDVIINLFVSDDFSTDGSWSFLQSYKINNIRLLPQIEKFGGAAPNFYRLISEVDFSGFDYVAFADQDDIWHDDKLQRAVNTLKQNDADVYSSNVTAFWEDGRETLINKAQPQQELDYLFEAAGPGCTYVFKKEVMLEFQKFVRALPTDIRKYVLHDWMAYAFCRERGYKWYIDPVPSMRYRQHDNNQVGTNNNLAAFQKRFKIIREKKFRKQVELLTSVVAPDKLPQIANRLYLIKNFKQLRRRSRDRYFLLLMLLLNIY